MKTWQLKRKKMKKFAMLIALAVASVASSQAQDLGV